MFETFRQWWQRGIVRRSNISQQQWQQAMTRLPLLQRLNQQEKDRLIYLSTLFLHYKSIEPAHQLNLSLEMRLNIALQACLPILNLDINWYDGWVSVIVYPAQFRPHRKVIDENGLEYTSNETLAGESWQRGPVILSWQDTAQAGHLDGYNLVIHEFAHKLDGLNGKTNGFPPLHPGMDTNQWSEVFSQAYEDFQHRLLGDQYIPLDPYAGQSPAEFFAVLSEVFFERPDNIRQYYPKVYEQLALFYRQTP